MKPFLIVLGLVMTLVSPWTARAEMPQTDVDLLAQLDTHTTPQKLLALDRYYALHVSELDVQMKIEIRTGAFFALRGATESGDAAAISQAQLALDGAGATVKTVQAENLKLRNQLSDLTGIDFDASLVMAPDAPSATKAVPAGVANDLVTAHAQAWTAIQAARRAWKNARLDLLDVQERYNQGEKVPIGSALRAITKAEIGMALAAGAYRLVEAKIAASLGVSMRDALNDL